MGWLVIKVYVNPIPLTAKSPGFSPVAEKVKD